MVVQALRVAVVPHRVLDVVHYIYMDPSVCQHARRRMPACLTTLISIVNDAKHLEWAIACLTGHSVIALDLVRPPHSTYLI